MKPRRNVLERVRLSILLVLLVIASVGAGACSGGSDDEPLPTSTVGASGNLLENAGFEAGEAPWFTIAEESGFEVTSEQAHSGDYSAVLRMDDPAFASGNKVYYLVQEIDPGELPEVVEGFYRVENWNRGAMRQYVQFVIIAIGPDNFPDFASNFQLRYLLAGQEVPPFGIRNAHFVFVNRDEPVQGDWVRFSLNIRDDFEAYWHMVPEGFEKLRLLFEVRWDSKDTGSGAPRGDVYYDDLYIGDRRN